MKRTSMVLSAAVAGAGGAEGAEELQVGAGSRAKLSCALGIGLQ